MLKSKITSLHIAVKIINKNIVQLLLSKGANVNAKDIIYQMIRILFSNKII